MSDFDDLFFMTERGRNIDGGQFYFASITWVIEDFRGRARKADENIVSPTFECSEATWEIKIFPNGERSDDTVGEVVIYLNRSTSDYFDKHTAEAEIAVHRHDGDEIFKMKRRFKDNAWSQKFNKTLYRRDVVTRNSAYLNFRGQFSLTCFLYIFNYNGMSCLLLPSLYDRTPSVEKKKDTPEKKDADTNTSSEDFDALDVGDGATKGKGDIVDLLTDIEALYNNPRFADVILRLGEHEFPAHKLVLRSRSKVFEAMFEHDMQENRQDTIDLVDMDIDTVNDMLRYIYCGKARHMSSEEALNLYVAADRYDLQGLVVKCRKSLLSQLSIDNLCEICAVADLHNDELLMGAVKSILSEDIKEILKTDKWVMFAKENQSLSLNLIQSAVLKD